MERVKDMTIFYYTATGNSLMVAKSLGGNLLSIPKMLKEEKTLFEDDIIGFVFPSYRGSIPTVVEEFIQRVKIKGTYTFAIVTYGSTAMWTGKHFAEIAKEKGLSLDYINQVKMVDTSLKFYDMEKEIKGEGKKNIDQKIKRITEDIDLKVSNNTRGNAITNAVSQIGYRAYRKEVGDCDKLFSVEESCTKCKVCQKVCPVDNINVDSIVTFNGKCIRCYACTQNCPQNAIRFKGEKSRARYRNSKVTLKEIISANN